MGTQLILTVGTNPLPVAVALEHLTKNLRKEDCLETPIKVRLVHTVQTSEEKKRLEEYWETKGLCSSSDFLDPIQTSAGDPKTVHKDIIGGIFNGTDEPANLHVHYTGGTQVMGVETVRAIQAKLQDDLDASYLDPRGDEDRRIVKPRLVGRSKELVADARESINITLEEIATLNGIKLRQFLKPNTYQLNRGKQWLNQNWPGPPCFRDGDKKDGDVLEHAAYAAFQTALKRRDTRTNWAIFRSVEGGRIQRSKHRDPQPFELDVVAVLGYQVVVVSCTTIKTAKPDGTSDSNGRMEIKRKAMEALIRAKQLGGEEARVVMLCCGENQFCLNMEEGLEDEMGDQSRHLRIWGKTRAGKLPTTKGLIDKFNVYLDELSW